MNQKIDGYAKIYLEYIAKQFSAYLGEMESFNGGVTFNSPPEPLKSVKIVNRKNKFLLGGLFTLQIVGEFEGKGLEADSLPINIGYEGVFKKGRAYFKHRNKEHEDILGSLNSNARLIDTLNGLDLEKGEISIGEGKFEIKLSPLSGSYMYMVVPPMRYSGSLPKSDIIGICEALYRICEVLQQRSALA